MNFREFLRTFYDDVIYRNDSYKWPNEKVKIQEKDLRLTLLTFWYFLALKCSLENNLNNKGVLNPIRQRES